MTENHHSITIETIDTELCDGLQPQRNKMNEKSQSQNNLFKYQSLRSMDTPFIQFICGNNFLIRVFYNCRSILSLPLSVHVVPKWVPFMPLPLIKHIYYFTYGELILLGGLIALGYFSYLSSFIQKDTEGSGKLAEYNLCLVYLTANKTNSLFSFLLGIPFERMIKWHMLTATLTLIVTSLHVYCVYIFGEASISEHVYGGNSPHFGKFLFDTEQNIAGSLLFLTLSLMTIPNLHPFIRRKVFELFYYSHIFLALLLIGIGFWYGLGYPMLIIGAWWFLDGIIRYVIMARFRYRPQACLKRLPGNRKIVKITFPKPTKFDYMAGQYLMICIPKISAFQFHPFSLSSAPHENTVSIHVRAIGNWTTAVADLADRVDEVKILIEGPYGNLSVDLESTRYKMVLLISGGIGITPMQSICNSLMYQVEHQGREMKKLYFLWMVREEESIGAMTDSSSTHMPGKEKHVRMNGFTPDLLSRKNASAVADEEVLMGGYHKQCDFGCNNNDDTDGGGDTDGSDTLWDEDFLHTEYFVTGCDDDKKEENTILTSHVKRGRPDWDIVFGKMKDFAESNDERRVAVCVCGPTKLIDDISAYCRKYSSPELSCKGVHFDVHHDVFEM